MSPTVHNILIHGVTVIEKALLPNGQLSEEAAEARNKYFLLYSDNFARKLSKTVCNLDIRLLFNSDSLLYGMRPSAKKKSFHFKRNLI